MTAGGTLSTLLEAIGYEPTDTVWLGILDHTPDIQYPFSNRPATTATVDALVQKHTLDGKGVYLMVNRSSADTSKNNRGDVQAVTQVMALWADIDVKPGGMPSWEAAGELIDRLSYVLGVAPVAIVNSGHGLQPYWPLDDEQVTDENRADAMRLVERWGALVRVQAQLVGGNVDSVFDLPRVLRAPGGVNYKNPAEPKVVTLHLTGEHTPYSFAQLADVLDEWGIPEVAVVDLGTKVADLASWNGGDITHGLDCEWFAARVDDLSRATPAARHPWMLGAAIELMAGVRNGCISMAEGIAGITRVGQRFEELLQSGENPRPLAKNELPSMMQYAIRFVEALTQEQVHEQVGYHVHELPGVDSPFGSGDAEADPAVSTASLVDRTPPLRQPLDEFAYAAKIDPTGDAGVAFNVSQALEGRYLLTPEGNPLRWTGAYWEDDRLGQFEADFQVALTKYMRDLYSRRQINPEAAAKMTKMAAAGGGEKLLRRWNRLIVDPMLLNANPLELCTPGGIVDLVTARVRPAEALKDLNTQITLFAPEIGAPQRWMAFLKQMIVDDERIEYLQRVLGATLIGDQRWPDLPVFHGKGNNGKSVILKVLGDALGGYSKALPEGFLTARSQQQHPTELADLRGARLVTLSETDPHGKFNESRLKSLTGGDDVRARKMRQDFEQFVATWMFLLALNHLPQVASGGDSLFRRLAIITFDVQIKEHQINPLLPKQLLDEEGGQILSWLIEGAKKALQVGLGRPRRVIDDTLRYRYEEDHVANFVAEMLTPNPTGKVSREDLQRVYARWCRLNVQEPLPGPQFFRELPAKIDLRSPSEGEARHYVYGVVLTADLDNEKNGFVQPAGSDHQTRAAGDHPE